MKLRRALTMASLVLAGESIYTLPYYLRRDYASVILDATGMTNTELGTLSSMFGVFALLCYFPGGWLADRFSARSLLVVSLVSTAVGGILLTTLPGYAAMLALFGLWGITSILTFWGALIKATRAWGGKGEQGRAFGILDGGRGVVGALLASLALALFSRIDASSADGGVSGLRAVIWLYSIGALAAALFCWLAVPADEEPAAGGERLELPREPRPLWAVARMPIVWLQALVILTAYAGYWGTFDVALYAVDGYGYSAADAAAVSTFGAWLRPVACIGSGFLADRIGTSRAIVGAFVVMVAAFVSLALTPAGPNTTQLLWANTAAICGSIFALRGIYYALMEEGDVPVHLTGTAVGVVSIIGYTPDIFAPAVLGWLTDTHPGADGHRMFFALIAVGGVIGLGAALMAARRVRARDAVAVC